MTLQEYNDIYKLPIIKSITITSNGGVTITNTNIVSEKMSLEKSLCSEDNLRYGRCEAACFKITIADISHDFTGEILTVVQDVKTDDKGYLLTENDLYLLTEDGKKILLSDEERIDVHVVLGQFKVLSDKPTNDRRWRELTCYDTMRDILNADVAAWYNNLTFPMTIKNLRDSFFNYLGITQETVTLINDSFVTQGGFSVVGTLSGKTVIEAICELNGCFGQITRTGTFDYVSLIGADTLTLDYYADGTGAYEDYTTDYITGIVARGTDTDVGTFVGINTNVYVIQGNPLIYGAEGTQALTTALGNLLQHIGSDTFRPFSVQTYGNPMLPLGTQLTVNTRDKTIVSNVITKKMTGIQGLRDKYEAKSGKTQPALVNSVANDIVRTKGKVHELEINVDGLTSRVTTTENNLSGNYYTKAQTDSEISQSATGIMTQVSQNYVTQLTYNDEIQNLQDQIDGRIEYFDGNVIPTLNNLPASSWTTAAMKDSHVGDLYRYHYTEDGIDKTDYYRFDKNTSTTPPTYSWVTLGESDVDEALRQAALANQKADAAQAQLDTLEQTVQDDYATKSEVSSSISQSASAIETNVSQTYETKVDAANKQSQITANATSISQLSDKIVLKVTSGGKVVAVRLSADPEGADFKIKADNIEFIANNEILLTTNNLAIKSTNFEVTKEGSITSKSGTIGGWNIGADALTSVYPSGNNRNEVGMKSFTGSDLTREAFYVRSSTNGGSSWTDQFYVRWNGQLFARNADITGTITTNNLTATGGLIGSWHITTNSIYSEYISDNRNTRHRVTIRTNQGAATDSAIYTRSTTDGGSNYTYPFVLRYDGKLKSTNAEITGTITANTLFFYDKLKARSNYSGISGYDLFTHESSTEEIYGRFNNIYGERAITIIGYSAGEWADYRGVLNGNWWTDGSMHLKSHLYSNSLYWGGSGNTKYMYSGASANYGWIDFRANASSVSTNILMYPGYIQICGHKFTKNGSTSLYEGLDLGAGSTSAAPYIDFHYNENTADYTYRIIQRGADTIDFIGHNASTWGTLRALSFSVQSSKYVKENIKTITEKEAKKLLELRPVSFDYINGNTNNRGLIAEEVLDIYPEMVNVPEGYEKFDENNPSNSLSIDYAKFVPYLIKMVQMQQKQIDSLLKSK